MALAIKVAIFLPKSMANMEDFTRHDRTVIRATKILLLIFNLHKCVLQHGIVGFSVSYVVLPKKKHKSIEGKMT